MAKNQFLNNARSVARTIANRQFMEGGIRQAEEEEFEFCGEFVSSKAERLKIEFTKISDAFSREVAEKADYEEFLELKCILDDIREQLPYANEDNYHLFEEKIVYLQLLTGVRVSFYSAYLRTIEKLAIGIELSRYYNSAPDYVSVIAAEEVKRQKRDRPKVKKEKKEPKDDTPPNPTTPNPTTPKRRTIDDAELRDRYFSIFDTKKKGPRS